MEVSGQLHAQVALHPRERDPGTHWIGGWVSSRAGLDALVNPCREMNPDHQARGPVTVLTELSHLHVNQTGRLSIIQCCRWMLQCVDYCIIYPGNVVMFFKT